MRVAEEKRALDLARERQAVKARSSRRAVWLRLVAAAGALGAVALAMIYLMPATKVSGPEPSFKLKLDTELHFYKS